MAVSAQLLMSSTRKRKGSGDEEEAASGEAQQQLLGRRDGKNKRILPPFEERLSTEFSLSLRRAWKEWPISDHVRHLLRRDTLPITAGSGRIVLPPPAGQRSGPHYILCPKTSFAEFVRLCQYGTEPDSPLRHQNNQRSVVSPGLRPSLALLPHRGAAMEWGWVTRRDLHLPANAEDVAKALAEQVEREGVASLLGLKESSGAQAGGDETGNVCKQKVMICALSSSTARYLRFCLAWLLACAFSFLSLSLFSFSDNHTTKTRSRSRSKAVNAV